MKMYFWSIMLAIMLVFSFTAQSETNIPDPIFASAAGDQVTVPIVLAASPYLVDRETGKYLGNLNSNQYDVNSVANEFGRYGSPYSNDSANNPYATNAPAIIHRE